MSILFGTSESKQNWSLIHQFLEHINTWLNKPDGPGSSEVSDYGDQNSQVEDDSKDGPVSLLNSLHTREPLLKTEGYESCLTRYSVTVVVLSST